MKNSVDNIIDKEVDKKVSYDELTYEKAMELLESKVSMLEQGTLPLDDTMDVFKDGMELVAVCEKKLSEFEGRISKLVEENETVGEVELDV